MLTLWQQLANNFDLHKQTLTNTLAEISNIQMAGMSDQV